MKICTIIGARPQFIKAAPVSRALNAIPGMQECLVHTGQHYDSNMSDVFFTELGIPKPHRNLEIGSGNHGAQTGRMLEALERVMLEEQPDWVLVYGDTNSTLAGALAAAKLHIPIAHVEAGLRSFNKRMPEEINRILTDHAASLLFTPTDTATHHLEQEGIATSLIEQVGDVMYDAALYYGEIARQKSHVLDRLGLQPEGYILSTVHRAENTGDPKRLQAIFEGLQKVSSNIPVILPMHPRTRATLEKNGQLDLTQGITLIEPVGYLDMVMLERHAALIATDSGGVQKEAYFYQRPCVTLRDETEWVELVELGWNTLLTPNNGKQIADSILKQIGTSGRPENLYGEGNSADLIARRLVQ
ncbi:UDP-N-acetylglucosamine 2-epimerase (non-hydrolyzing) [bacterium endosymbiont of Escarpia laminata]|nr:MAG: UDP-N-acetylglucosamine 2-epimerase (non-hydrolyzing) [bacterium endosymbiont of Escarpia laminata]